MIKVGLLTRNVPDCKFKYKFVFICLYKLLVTIIFFLQNFRIPYTTLEM